jgi:hypothetical protein
MAVTDDALGTAGMIGMGSYNDIALFDDFQEGAGGTGIFEPSRMKIAIYPNPALDRLFVKTDRNVQKLVISNIVGQQCMSLNTLESGVTEIDISTLPSGVYFMTVHGPGGDVSTRKFIIR